MKLRYDELRSNCVFNINVRRYTEAEDGGLREELAAVVTEAEYRRDAAADSIDKVVVEVKRVELFIGAAADEARKELNLARADAAAQAGRLEDLKQSARMETHGGSKTDARAADLQRAESAAVRRCKMIR